MRAGFQCVLRGRVVAGSAAIFAIAVAGSLVLAVVRAASASTPVAAALPVAVAASPTASAAAPVVAASAARETFLRRRIAELALEQLSTPDPRWEPAQRDCAGLIRFAFRAAFHRFEPGRALPLFADESGKPAEFADARTLIANTFVPMGRGADARSALRNGDLLAFRIDGGQGEPEHHLMLVVVPEGASPNSALVVYHPGQPGAAIRTGTLRALEEEAPIEWRPVPQNAAFLGFHRFKEWVR